MPYIQPWYGQILESNKYLHTVELQCIALILEFFACFVKLNFAGTGAARGGLGGPVPPPFESAQFYKSY